MNYDALLSRQNDAFVSPALRQITLEVQKVDGINLGQGVCQLPVPPLVLEAAEKALVDGINRYTNPRGLLSLREALAQKLSHFNKIPGLDPELHVLATSGVTGALEAVCALLLNPGDEVILFEPSYPYHVQVLNRFQAVIKTIPLRQPDWSFDIEEVKAAISPRTKFILVNTPGNPTGKVFTKEELLQIGAVLEGTNAMMVTDEIYEYMAFDGSTHLSAASLPELEGRVITMGGYSKTFSITGWRIGYIAAPEALTARLASVLDAIYVCPPAPLQEAVAQGIFAFKDDFYETLRLKYQGKRDLFVEGLRRIGLDPFVPAGAYYLLAKYNDALESYPFVNKMIATAKVGAVPSDDFVRNPHGEHWIRFCLAVEDPILVDALERLGKLSAISV